MRAEPTVRRRLAALMAHEAVLLLRLALADLLLQVLQFGPAIQGVGELLLPVELDDQVAGFHGAPRTDQPGNHERLRVRP